MSLDPRIRLLLLLCVGTVAICLDRPSSLAALALVCALPLLRLPSLWRRRAALVVLAVIWSTVMSQGLFYAEQPRVPLFTVGPVSVWREGVQHGLVQSLRFVSMALTGLSVAVSTAPDRLHAALLRLRMPFGLALMASTSLRLLPELADELMTVRRARARRGRPAHHRAPWAWLALELGMLRPVVARSVRRARTLAESLDARGFDPLAPRAVWRPLRMGALDWAALGSGLGLTLALVTVRLLTLLYASDTWYSPSLRPLYGFVGDWL